MIFLLANWRWLIPTAVAGILAAMLTFTKLELANLKAADAAAAVKAVEAARLKDEHFNQIARDAERQHNEDAKKTADLYDANLALTRNGVRFKTIGRCLPKDTKPPGDTVDGTAEVRLPDETVRDLLKLARDADTAADYARVGHEWANKLTQP